MLQLDAVGSIILSAGRSGTGKTTWAIRYLIANHKLRCRYIFDPEGEYSQRLGLPAAETKEELQCAVADGWALFDPHTLFPGQLTKAFDWFCGWCFEQSSAMAGKKALLTDEAWKYCSPAAIPQALANCIQTGRKRGLDSIFCTQRPNRLNGAILNEVTELVAFRLQDVNALKRLEENYGVSADEIRALPLGSFISYNINSGGELRGKIF